MRPTHIRDITMKRTWMKKTNSSSSWMVTILFSSIFCVGTISCTKARRMNIKDFDNVLLTPAEDTTIIKISSFIIPQKSNLNIYKSPSKTADKLVYVTDDEASEADGVGGYYAWKETSTAEGIYYMALPVIEKIDDWYKVYVETALYEDFEYQFVGYVPSEDWVEAIRQDITEDVMKSYCDEFLRNEFHKDTNYYVSWGMNDFGENYFVIGKIVDGVTYETDRISYGHEDENDPDLYLLVENRLNPLRLTKEFRNVKISTDFSHYKNADFEKVLSVIGNKFPNIQIKLKGEIILYTIPTEGEVNGRKIEWIFK